MSRKTIIFKIPGVEAKRGAQAPADEAAQRPLGADAEAVGTAEDAESDRWIQARDSPALAAFAPAAPERAASVEPGATLDLRADRTFAEVVALSLTLPLALGWFWAVNAFDRYRRLLAA